MPRNSKPRKIIAASANISPAAAAIIAASKAPVPTVTNVAPIGTAAALQAPHSNVAAVTKAPAIKAAVTAPATDAPATDAPSVAKPVRGLTRAHRVIDAMRYPFETESDTDGDYLPFFCGFVKRGNGSFTLAETLGFRPTGYTIDNNPARLLRAVKAGYFTVTGTGAQRVATATPKLTTHKAYAAIPARAAD